MNEVRFWELLYEELKKAMKDIDLGSADMSDFEELMAMTDMHLLSAQALLVITANGPDRLGKRDQRKTRFIYLLAKSHTLAQAVACDAMKEARKKHEKESEIPF